MADGRPSPEADVIATLVALAASGRLPGWEIGDGHDLAASLPIGGNARCWITVHGVRLEITVKRTRICPVCGRHETRDHTEFEDLGWMTRSGQPDDGGWKDCEPKPDALSVLLEENDGNG